MKNSSEFLRAIEQTSEKERDDIENRIRDYTAQRERQSRENAEKLYADYIRERAEEHSATGGGTENDAANRVRQSVSAARQEIEDRTFESAAKKLTEFTKTPEYADFILNSAKQAVSAAAGNPLVIFVRGADMKFASEIRAVSPDITLETDDTIGTGGIRARSDGARLFMDDTLDTRLQAQREYFREFSGLGKI